MTYRVLIHALFNCIADCYGGKALKALADSLGVTIASPSGDYGATHLESVSRLIDECRWTGRFWDLFSAVYPLPVKRLDDVRLSLSTASRIVATLTPDLDLEHGPILLPKDSPKIGLWAYCCRRDWPSQEDPDDILDDCILHIVVLGNPSAGANRGDGLEWVRKACTRYGDLPVLFCLPEGTQEAWQRVLTTHGVLVPTSAYEYPATFNEWKITGRFYAWILDQVDSIRRHLKEQLNDERIFLLHISDIHLGAAGDPTWAAEQHFLHLEQDLSTELRLQTLDYVVVSGDIANTAKGEEYEAALSFFKMLREKFKGRGGRDLRIIIVPGNHDVDYRASQRAYTLGSRRGLNGPYPAGYKRRFGNFNSGLYEQLFSSSYPANCDAQSMVRDFPDDGMLFACINTAWEIDHLNEDRASIHPNAMSRFQRAHTLPDDRLKILVTHHLIDKMPDQGQMAWLTTQGFLMCLHGHVHEARKGVYPYDGTRSMHFVGAGTVGARPENQRPGVPLQYNLIVLDNKTRTALVETRRREKPFEPWWADARWGPDLNDPIPRYVFTV